MLPLTVILVAGLVIVMFVTGTVAAVTVTRIMFDVIPSADAVIAVVPGETAVINPLELIIAIAGLLEFHVIVEVVFVGVIVDVN